MSDVAIIETGAVVDATAPGAANLLPIIAQIAASPDIQLDVFTLLLDRQAALEAKQAEQAFWAAMNKAQGEIAPVVRDADNSQTRSKYAKLETVDGVIRPIYAKHGFSVSYDTVTPETPGNVRVRCKIGHTGGHVETYHREAAPDTVGPKGNAVKTALHGAGSTETYLRRYIVCGAFNVVLRNEDSDGNRSDVPDDPTIVTEAQALAIEAMLRKTKVNRAEFMAHYAVTSLLDMTVGAYEDASRRLQARMIQMEAEGATTDGANG